MAAEAGLAVGDTVGLLARYGRDVAGALVIADECPGERPGTAVPYDERSLAQEVAGLEGPPTSGVPGSSQQRRRACIWPNAARLLGA